MPNAQAVSEYRKQHPDVRIWGVTKFSEESGLGDYPVIPFDDHLSEISRVRELEYDRTVDLMTACMESGIPMPMVAFGLLYAQLPEIGWDEALNRARRRGE